MDTRILELAIEALEARKRSVEAEIQALNSQIKTGFPPPVKQAKQAPGVRKRRPKTAAEKEAQSQKMREYWAKRKKTAGAPAKPAKAKRQVKSTARKAQSERMKLFWAKRRAEAAKKSE